MRRVRVWLIAAVVLASFIVAGGVAFVSLAPAGSAEPSAAQSSPTTSGAPGSASESETSTAQPSTTTPKPVAPPVYHTVDPGLAAEVTKKGAPAEGIKAVFLADAPALKDPSFIKVASSLTKLTNNLYAGLLTKVALSTLKNVPGLKVSSDRMIKVDPPIKETGSSFNVKWDAETTVANIDPQLATTRTSLGIQGTGQGIAIVDTGIDTHAVGLGGTKVVLRKDFSADSKNPPSCTDGGYLDPIGHGTHVASIAAGAVNATDPGIVGVAPGASLFDLRVFDCEGGSPVHGIDLALQWILDNHNLESPKITVVNLSLGCSPDPINGPCATDGLDPTSILVNRLVAAGVFVSVAAGNSGDAAGTIYSPGDAAFASTVGSASVSQYGQFLSPFSSQGATDPSEDRWPSFLAAGSSIRAAKSTALTFPGDSWVISGTSMATPYVAGLAALVRQKTGDKPLGSSCIVAQPCPYGAILTSNPLQADIASKASDWFTPGPDNLTGAGLISPHNALLGGAVVTPAAQHLEVSLDSASPGILAVPAHTQGVTITLLTDSSVKQSATSTDSLEYTWLDASGNTTSAQVPCNLEIDFGPMCFWDSGTWNQREWYFYSPPTAQTTWLQIRTTRNLGAEITGPGLPSAIGFTNGIAASDVILDASGNATVTITRTLASASATSIDIVPSSGLTAPANVVLPAGSIGTNVTAAVSMVGGYTPPAHENSGRISLSTGGTPIAAVSVQYFTASGSGRITVGGKQLSMGNLTSNGLRISSNGTMWGSSTQAGLSRGAGLEGPFIVLPGTNNAVPVAITQTVTSAIDLLGISSDGTKMLLGEAGSGRGIVSGDTDSRYVEFVHDTSSNSNTEIGAAPYGDATGFDGSSAISETGNTASFFVKGSAYYLLYWQGTSSSTLHWIDQIPAISNVRISGINDTYILLEICDPTVGLCELRRYEVLSSFGFYTVVAENVIPGETSISADGSAIAYMYFDFNTLDYGMACAAQPSGNVSTYDITGYSPELVGTPIPTSNCGHVIDTLAVNPSTPNGDVASELVKLSTSASPLVLAGSFPDDQNFSWTTDSTGNNIFTVTGQQLEAGDTNGLNDAYRGLFGSPALAGPQPTIYGLPAIGSKLVAMPGAWGPGTVALTYKWYRDGIPIASATGSTYTLTPTDVGTGITLAVTGKESGYVPDTEISTSLTFGYALNRSTTVTPTVVGTPEVGHTLTASSAAWSPVQTFQYQWSRNGAPILYATNSTYDLVASDAGTSITATVIGAGFSTTYIPEARTSAPLAIKSLLTATPVPTITGLGRVGQVLTATPGTWTPSPVAITYQWKRNGTAIVGATAAMYTLVTADAGQSITVVATGTKAAYSIVSEESVPTNVESLLTPAIPTITGSHAIGGTLTAVPGFWAPGGVAFTYQWNRGGIPIPGATNSTYASVFADGSQSITVTVSGSLAAYTPASTTSDFIVVTRPHLSAPIPTIVHPPTMLTGSKVSAGTQNWGPTPLTLTYIWFRDGVAISGATSAKYTLVSADFGHALTVLVTGSKQGYTTVQMSSFPLNVH